MMKMNRAVMWMLTSADYGDWEVHGIYTDKAEACRAAERANLSRKAGEDEYRVEEAPVLDGIMPRRVERIRIIGFPLKKGAETEEHPRGTHVAFDQQYAAPLATFEKYTGRLHVSGEPEAAHKAYAEHAARIKADAEGITR